MESEAWQIKISVDKVQEKIPLFNLSGLYLFIYKSGQLIKIFHLQMVLFFLKYINAAVCMLAAVLY